MACHDFQFLLVQIGSIRWTCSDHRHWGPCYKANANIGGPVSRNLGVTDVHAVGPHSATEWAPLHQPGSWILDLFSRFFFQDPATRCTFLPLVSMPHIHVKAHENLIRRTCHLKK
eukprot:Pompholyxophrys_punicea_v1_NODE_73_length_3747_cov_4.524377.p5 type:complete len:115 gc:universal NODE_73_length_3747_cov_4.524377:3016-2672(-)